MYSAFIFQTEIFVHAKPAIVVCNHLFGEGEHVF